MFSREGGSPDWVPAFAGKHGWRGSRAMPFVILDDIVIPAQAGIHKLDHSRFNRAVSRYGFPPPRE